MIVTWVTLDHVNESVVEYGVGQVYKRKHGSNHVFTDGGKEKRTMIIHRVLLKDLIPGETYSNF